MLAILSPSKTQDFEQAIPAHITPTQPRQLGESERLAEILRSFNQSKLGNMLNVSEKLATLNHQRYQNWHTPFTVGNAKPAGYAFQGDVYDGLDFANLDRLAQDWAQQHIRMLSGLYGALRPYDLMQAYRLEMGTKLPSERGEDLYDFWGERITQQLNDDINASGSELLINLASNEYFKSLRPKQLNARIITPIFKDVKNGKAKIISFYAKKARGTYANWLATVQPRDVASLTRFTGMDYSYHADRSNPDKGELVFIRS